MSAPIDTRPCLGSLSKNQICGLGYVGEGTYTTEGINKLCEVLKGSAVTSLKCAAAQECRPRVFAFVSAPIDTHSFSFPWQLGRQPALRRRSSWQRHLHH